MSAANKMKAKALLDDTAMSTRAVSTAISKAKTYLAQLYNHQRGMSTAISKAKAYLSCIPTAIKTTAKALLDDTAVSTSAVYQPRSAKREYI